MMKKTPSNAHTAKTPLRRTVKRLASYAALGTVGAFGPNSADAVLITNSGSITSGPGPNPGETQWSIDLDGDTVSDINLLLDPDGGFLYPGEPGPYPILQATGGSVAAVYQTIPGYGIYVYAQKFAQSVSFGTSIGVGPNSNWRPDAQMRDRTGFVNSQWRNPTEGALGIRFTIGPHTHYGFVNVGITDTFPPGTNAPVIGTYGYESVPNTNVHVSAIPEPSPMTSLSLLAAGAAGLAALRRRMDTSASAQTENDASVS